MSNVFKGTGAYRKTIDAVLNAKETADKWMYNEGLTLDDMTQEEYRDMIFEVMKMSTKQIRKITRRKKNGV